MITTNEALIALIKKFTSGEDTSISSANAIEVKLDDAFPADEEIQDIVLMLASYRPGGGKYLYAEEEIKIQLEKVLQKLR
jgi:hypothetical protein